VLASIASASPSPNAVHAHNPLLTDLAQRTSIMANALQGQRAEIEDRICAIDYELDEIDSDRNEIDNKNIKLGARTDISLAEKNVS
jgi:hypothetical protein